MRFAVGQRVRLVKDNGGFGEVGELGTVTVVNLADDIEVAFDSSGKWWTTEDHLESADASDANDEILDPEAVALANAVDLIEPLTEDARIRICDYLNARFN